jgi:hypothetical protein
MTSLKTQAVEILSNSRTFFRAGFPFAESMGSVFNKELIRVPRGLAVYEVLLKFPFERIRRGWRCGVGLGLSEKPEGRKNKS